EAGLGHVVSSGARAARWSDLVRSGAPAQVGGRGTTARAARAREGARGIGPFRPTNVKRNASAHRSNDEGIPPSASSGASVIANLAAHFDHFRVGPFLSFLDRSKMQGNPVSLERRPR